jgi:hypothetical protein
MKMHIEITESYTTGICTVWQTDHGRRLIISTLRLFFLPPNTPPSSTLVE